MAKQKQPGNLLPHNPLTAAGVLEEIKRIKGGKTWPQWELEILTAQYPDNATFKAALEQYTTKGAATTQTTTPPGPKGKAASKKEAK